MKLLATAVPLFDSEMAVGAYRLSYQNSDKLFGISNNYTALDGAMFSPGLDLIQFTGIEPFTGGKPLFVNMNQYQLMAGALNNSNIPPALLVCVFSKDLPLTAEYYKQCIELNKRGFGLALDGIEYTQDSAVFYNIADYVVIDIASPNSLDRMRQIAVKAAGIKTLLTNVSDKATFEGIKNFPNTLYEGNFYTQPLTKGVHEVSPLKANYLRLLKMMREENFNVDEIGALIGQDASLPISLLRFINSPAIGLIQRVDSINQALALLGANETWKWMTAVVSTLIAEDKPSEITKLSLTRAKFAENLAAAFGLAAHSSGLFMMGLFSLLDVILDMPMEKAIQEISVSAPIMEALVEQKGPYYDVLRLLYSYERADWQSVSYILIMNNVNPEGIYQAFIQALLWYKSLL